MGDLTWAQTAADFAVPGGLGAAPYGATRWRLYPVAEVAQ